MMQHNSSLLKMSIDGLFEEHGGQLRETLAGRRKESLFLTQKKEPVKDEIVEKHAELNKYIDVLDEKIHKIVEHNEAEMLFAYRHHLERVKRDMEQLKHKANANATSASSQLQKIDSLEKQLIVFRTEALRLFEKLVEKDKTIEELTIRLDQFRAESQHMNASMKSILRKNKNLQNARNAAPLKHISVDMEMLQLDSKPFKASAKTYYGSSRYRQRVNSMMGTKFNTSTVEVEKTADEGEMGKEKLACQPALAQEMVVKTIHQHTAMQKRRQVWAYRPIGHQDTRKKSNYASQSKNCKDSRTELSSKANESAQRGELMSFYVRCVETVKREVMRRRNISSLNYFKGTSISLEDFKKVDCLRLVELIFSDDRILEGVYKMIFS